MARENEIDRDAPRLTRFGTLTKVVVDRVLFREDGVYAVDAATGKTYLLWEELEVPNGFRNVMRVIAERLKLKIAEEETPPAPID